MFLLFLMALFTRTIVLKPPIVHGSPNGLRDTENQSVNTSASTPKTTPKASFVVENKFSDIYVSEAARQQPLNSSIFIWVMTTPKYHNTRIPAINNTWLKKFEHGTVFTSEKLKDEHIPYRLPFRNFDENYYKIFYKTKFAFYYAYEGISKHFDWYLKADDDTFVIKENLEKFLNTLDPNDTIYVGYPWRHVFKTGHNSGSLYAISRAAMKVFVEKIYHNETACPFDNLEDTGMARCLASAGIYPIESGDFKHRERFMPFSPFSTYSGLGHNSFDPFPSDLISIHYMRPEDMIMAELLLNKVDKN